MTSPSTAADPPSISDTIFITSGFALLPSVPTLAHYQRFSDSLFFFAPRINYFFLGLVLASLECLCPHACVPRSSLIVSSYTPKIFFRHYLVYAACVAWRKRKEETDACPTRILTHCL